MSRDIFSCFLGGILYSGLFHMKSIKLGVVQYLLRRNKFSDYVKSKMYHQNVSLLPEQSIPNHIPVLNLCPWNQTSELLANSSKTQEHSNHALCTGTPTLTHPRARTHTHTRIPHTQMCHTCILVHMQIHVYTHTQCSHTHTHARSHPHTVACLCQGSKPRNTIIVGVDVAFSKWHRIIWKNWVTCG